MDKQYREQITDEVLRRDLVLDRKRVNNDTKTVPASLSSETPVSRYFGNEILNHTPQAIDLTRAEDGLPMLFGHDQSQPIGLVRDIHIDNGKLRGVLHFSDNSKAQEVWRDVSNGFLKNISIGYSIKEWQESGENDDITVTRWELLETSVVSVPADNNVGINRSRGTNMDQPTDTPELKLLENNAQWQKREQERRLEIRALFTPFGDKHRDLMDNILDDPQITRERASEILLNKIGENAEPLGGSSRQANMDTAYSAVSSGHNNKSEFARAAEDALLIRNHVNVESPHPAARDLKRTSLIDMAKIMLEDKGIRTQGMNVSQLISHRLHGTSDFSSLLANVANKSLISGFESEPASHRIWCKESEARDFKEQSRVALSEAPGLDLVNENGEYTYGTFGERAETFALKTYGKMFSITRQAIINDDLSAFTRLPQAFGQSAARKEADLVYSILTTNGNMSDGTALFHADHSNLEGTPSALSVTSLGVARAEMRKQTGINGLGVMNIVPRYLIVPAALETTAEQLIASLVDPSKSNDTPNLKFIRSLQLVVDPRLDADSETAWYLAADWGQVDTVEIAYLDGYRGIQYEEHDLITRDGLDIKARLDFAAAPVDWRGLYKNAGA